ARLSAPESGGVVSVLIAAGRYDVAHDLWLSMLESENETNRRPVMWNGGFELETPRGFGHFDWSLNKSEYAEASIDTRVAHEGSHSLKIQFYGRDTTALDNEFRELVRVSPGQKYRVECWALPVNVVTPEGPKIVVADVTKGTWLGASEPLPSGTTDWQRVSFEFTAPEPNASGSAAVYVSVKRKPRFVYDEPTKGAIWLDDFSMTEVR